MLRMASSSPLGIYFSSPTISRPVAYATDRCLRLSRCVVPAHIPTSSGSAKAVTRHS
jgi:hypothetical protein